MSGSMQGQVEWLFSRHRGTGESRRAWKDANRGFGKMANVTFAWNSERRYKCTSIEFVEWAQGRYGLSEIREVTSPMVKVYIEERQARGLSPRTLATDITGLRRLGLYLVLEQWHTHNFVPDDLSVPHGSHPRYSYMPEHAKKIIEHVAKRDERAAQVLRWQLDCGLRISEAIRLRPDRVDFDAGTIEVKGKGGKKRVIKVSDRMLLDRLPRSGTFPLLNGNATSWTRQIEKLVAAACAELDIQCLGTHGFRASAAQRTLDDLLESGVDERSARKQVSRLLGHNRTSVTRSYAP